jgi:outer membrane protein
MKRMTRYLACLFSSIALALIAAGTATAEEYKIGYVSIDRILRDSSPAKAASAKLEQEFAKRDRDIKDLEEKVKAAAARFDKDAPVLTEADRGRRQREVTDMDRDLQRRKREASDDLTQRRNDELRAVLDRAQRIILQLAEQEKYDLIQQEAVYASPRVDITEKVIKILNAAK